MTWTMGASYAKANARAIRQDGRWALYATMGGAAVDGPFLGWLLAKRARLLPSTLRSQSLEYRESLIADFEANHRGQLDAAQPLVSHAPTASWNASDFGFGVVVDRVMDIGDAQAAHDAMETDENCGKIVLRCTRS